MVSREETAAHQLRKRVQWCTLGAVTAIGNLYLRTGQHHDRSGRVPMFIWTWDSYQTSQAGRDRMTRYWRNTMLSVALLGTVVAAITLHGMHADWIGGTALSAILLAVVAVGLRPQDIGWPTPVKISVAQLLARGLQTAGGRAANCVADAISAAVARDLKAVDVASCDMESLSAKLQSHVAIAVATVARSVTTLTRAADDHVGVCHIALVARAVPAPRSDRALTAAA